MAPRARAGSRGTFCAVVLALLMLAAAAVPTIAQDGEEETAWARLPELRVSDEWTYELSGRDTGQIMNEVAAFEPGKANTYFGDRVDTYRIESSGTVYSDQAAGPLTRPGAAPAQTETEHEIDAKKWVRIDDHATVQLEGQVIIEGTVDAEVVESFSPSFVQFFFPFTTGYKWVSVTDYYLKRGGDDPKTGKADLQAHVTGQERVQVPAGTFDAWRIQIDIEYEGDRVTSNVVQWWSQEVCSLVKEERYDTDRQLVNTMVLTEYRCSGDHVEEPDYSERGVRLTATGGNQPPWLDDPLPVDPDGDENSQGVGSALPSGPIVWVAVGVMAGISVTFLILGRRRR